MWIQKLTLFGETVRIGQWVSGSRWGVAMSEGAACERSQCERPLPRKVRKDFKTLATFVELFCHDLHGEQPQAAMELKVCPPEQVMGRPVLLCPECRRLLAHAFVKRLNCPMDPKPACKHCPKHCYHPTYRQQMRAVMRHSGRKLVLSGRIDYLLQLLF